MTKTYECCRCGYTTIQKSRMKHHLYNRKIFCSIVYNDIELTDEIKEKILRDTKYNIPKKEKESTVINNITNHNTMNNYINNMDSMEKLGKYMNYKQLETLSIEDKIENKFARRIDNMKGDKFKFGYDLGNNRLFDIIDEISQIRDISELNIIYDNKLKELQLFKSGCWEKYLLDRGLREIIDIMKDYFLDYYEKFLFRKIYVTEKNEREKQQYKNHLIDYYKFIGCFDIYPFIKDKNDCEILGDNDGDYGVYKIEEKWMSKYKDAIDNMKRYEINKIKKDIDTIVKNNTVKNIKQLNKEIIDLVTNDEEFKAGLSL
jgi:hypothetical protein